MRSMLVQLRAFMVVVGLVCATTVAVAGPAQAAMPAFQMPFPCGEVWKASTYTSVPPLNPHHAIDWNAYPNDAGRAVVASAAGTATPFYDQYGGHQVRIDHGDGWKTVYAHLQEGGRANGSVNMGQTIGYVGNSGGGGTVLAYHLHWEQWHNNVLQTPLYANGVALNPGPSADQSAPAYTSNNCGSSSPDADNDGVSDSADQCPNQWGLPALNGCPDDDNDNVPNGSDQCPTLAGAGYPNGCTPVPGRLTGDFNADGKTDVAAFYRFDGNITTLFVFLGNGNGTFANPIVGSTQSGWDGLRTITAGVGDFNADGKLDIATFYRYDGNITTLFVFNGNGNGTFANPVAGSVQSGWDGRRTLSAGVGDFNADGKLDVVAFYRFDGNATTLFVFNGSGTSTFANPIAGSYQTGWDGLRATVAGVGDFNGDSHLDVAVFYGFDGNVTTLYVFNGNGNSTFANPTIGSTQTGWSKFRTLPTGVGDFNADGKLDVVAFYRYDNGVTVLFTFVGNGNGTFANPMYGSQQTGWDGLRTITSGVGNFNGDSQLDVATFYRFDGNETALFAFAGNGDGAFANPSWGSSQTGWDGLRTVA